MGPNIFKQILGDVNVDNPMFLNQQKCPTNINVETKTLGCQH